MKPIILVIGINDNELLTGAGLSNTGIQEYKTCALIHTLIGEFEDATEANICFQDSISKYEYLEIKTVYKRL